MQHVSEPELVVERLISTFNEHPTTSSGCIRRTPERGVRDGRPRRASTSF
jgi:hypothetical protein